MDLEKMFRQVFYASVVIAFLLLATYVVVSLATEQPYNGLQGLVYRVWRGM